MPNTATPETDRRFDDLEEPLAAIVVWAGLLDKIIEHDLTLPPDVEVRTTAPLRSLTGHIIRSQAISTS
jgi:hypothetical protein